MKVSKIFCVLLAVMVATLGNIYAQSDTSVAGARTVYEIKGEYPSGYSGIMTDYLKVNYAQYNKLEPVKVIEPQHFQKRYNIFFRVDKYNIDSNFKNNARTIEQMRKDIQHTLHMDGAVPDSLLILSTASPEGGYAYNKWLSGMRATSTENYLLKMFPEFKDAYIKVEFLEQDWGGLMQVLRKDLNFPQRKEMMDVLNDRSLSLEEREQRMKGLKTGWRYLVNNHIYALRNSSITLSVVVTDENMNDEFVRSVPVTPLQTLEFIPMFSLAQQPLQFKPKDPLPEYEEVIIRKMIFALRSNLLVPFLNVGMEFPIKDKWSVGVDYYFPWFVSKHNKWCSEMLGWFIDGKRWFTNEKTKWTMDDKLKGHAIGIFAGGGYYDYQNREKGAQGEYMDFGVDYTYAKPIANNKLRLEFTVGVGFLRTWYRTYKPSSDYEDLIKDPGIKQKTSNFIGPTRACVSLVLPIVVTKRYIK